MRPVSFIAWVVCCANSAYVWTPVLDHQSSITWGCLLLVFLTSDRTKQDTWILVSQEAAPSSLVAVWRLTSFSCLVLSLVKQCKDPSRGSASLLIIISDETSHPLEGGDIAAGISCGWLVRSAQIGTPGSGLLLFVSSCPFPRLALWIFYFPPSSLLFLRQGGSLTRSICTWRVSHFPNLGIEHSWRPISGGKGSLGHWPCLWSFVAHPELEWVSLFFITAVLRSL